MNADKQLKAYIDRVLRLKEEQDALGQDIREVYAEAKAEGYDKTVMGKLVAHLRKVLKEGDGAVAEAENVFDTYLQAYQRASGMAVATHAHEEDFDPETGEILDRDARRRQRTTAAMDDHKALVDEMADAGLISGEGRQENKALADAVATKFGNRPAQALQSPRKAAEAVSERTAFTSATIAPVLVEADKAEAVAGELGQPETIPALTVQHDGVNVGGPERAGVTVVGTESGTVANFEMHQRPSTNDEPSPEAGPQAEASPAGTGSGMLADREGRHEGEAASADLPTNSEIDPSEDRREGQSPDDGLSVVGANTGGDDVDGSVERAPGQQQGNTSNTAGALVNQAPAIKHRFRPNCQHRDHCRSGTVDHCHSCKQAMREGEAA